MANPSKQVNSPLHGLIAGLAMVRLSWLLVVLVRLAEDELVVPEAEGVFVYGDGIQVDIRVGTLSLPC